MTKHVFAILGARYPNDSNKNKSRCIVCDLPEAIALKHPTCRGYPMSIGTAQAKHDDRERKRKSLQRRLKREAR